MRPRNNVRLQGTPSVAFREQRITAFRRPRNATEGVPYSAAFQITGNYSTADPDRRFDSRHEFFTIQTPWESANGPPAVESEETNSPS